MAFFNTSPSLPPIPTIAVPTNIFAGAIDEAIDPPIVWILEIVTIPIPNFVAVSSCNAPNMMFELVLLPEIKVPKAPMNGEKIGKVFPVLFAINILIKVVIPVVVITIAITTIETVVSVVGMHWL